MADTVCVCVWSLVGPTGRHCVGSLGIVTKCGIWLCTASDDDVFILTTDADVRFSPESVESLLDLMIRDPCVGAVSARTFPQGSGPIYWYQIFDYAIGHWLQKVRMRCFNWGVWKMMLMTMIRSMRKVWRKRNQMRRKTRVGGVKGNGNGCRKKKSGSRSSRPR